MIGSRMKPSRAHLKIGFRQLSATVIILAMGLLTSFVPVLAIGSASTPKAGLPPRWNQLNPISTPSPRSGSAFAFDSATGQSILFGGTASGSEGSFLGDTWAWNGANWTQLHPSSAPSPRSGALLAYDRTRSVLVLYGGQSGIGPPFVSGSDTWTWDGENWHQQLPATSPSPRSGASMVYDPNSSQIVLFGGSNNTGALSETWIWNGSTWIQLHPANNPSGRFNASMADDKLGAQVVLFGGEGNSGAPLGDTWLWNGANWSQKSLAINPSARSGALIGEGGSVGSVVLEGGVGSSRLVTDTWLWSGGVWIPVTSANAPLDGNAMAFDSANDQIVLLDQLANTYSLGPGPTAPPGGCDLSLLSPAVSMVASESTTGYWIASADGQVASCGTAPHLSVQFSTNAPIVGMAASPTGEGYWLVASDGGIFAFGNAVFQGSMGGKVLNQPIVGIAADPSTGGYWEVASDGGIFAFNAPFQGSMGGKILNRPIVGIARAVSTGGYWEIAADGGVFSFFAEYYGSAR